MVDLGASTTVRALLSAHPETFSVLLSHGMCEDCRHDPPDVSLDHFAQKHCAGNLAGLLVEIRAAMGP